MHNLFWICFFWYPFSLSVSLSRMSFVSLLSSSWFLLLSHERWSLLYFFSLMLNKQGKCEKDVIYEGISKRTCNLMAKKTGSTRNIQKQLEVRSWFSGWMASGLNQRNKIEKKERAMQRRRRCREEEDDAKKKYKYREQGRSTSDRKLRNSKCFSFKANSDTRQEGS